LSDNAWQQNINENNFPRFPNFQKIEEGMRANIQVMSIDDSLMLHLIYKTGLLL
jgi:hypothetical protein